MWRYDKITVAGTVTGNTFSVRVPCAPGAVLEVLTLKWAQQNDANVGNRIPAVQMAEADSGALAYSHAPLVTTVALAALQASLSVGANMESNTIAPTTYYKGELIRLRFDRDALLTVTNAGAGAGDVFSNVEVRYRSALQTA